MFFFIYYSFRFMACVSFLNVRVLNLFVNSLWLNIAKNVANEMNRTIEFLKTNLTRSNRYFF